MKKNISVFCSSSENISDVYKEDAAKLGAFLGVHNINVINGGGSAGLMRVLSDSALANGGEVTGVIPKFMIQMGWCHKLLTKTIVTDTMHERKKIMYSLSDASIALPGGYGTLEELLEIITWRQLKLYSKPVLILNTLDFFRPLLTMIEMAHNQGFIKTENTKIPIVLQTPEELFSVMKEIGLVD